MAARLMLFVVSAYAVVWGATWVSADMSYGVSGTRPTGEPFQLHPGAWFGGLPPTPTPMSDAPPFLALIAGVVGIVAVGINLRRSRHAS